MADESSGTLGALSSTVGDFLTTLQSEFAGTGAIDLAAELGFRLPPTVVAGARTALDSAAGAAASLPGFIAALETAQGPIAIGLAVKNLLGAIAQLLTSLETLADAIRQAAQQVGGIDPTALAEFVDGFATRLFEYLLYVHLEGNFPRLLAVLGLFGIAKAAPVSPDPADPDRIAYLQRAVVLTRLKDALSNPIDVLTAEYGWGTPQFDAPTFLARIHALLYAFSVAATYTPGSSSRSAELDTALVTITPDQSVSPPGLSVALALPLQDTFDVTFPTIIDNWSIEVTSKGPLDRGLKVRFTPRTSISLVPPAGQLTGQVAVSLVGARPNSATNPYEILSLPGVGQLTAQTIRLQAGLNYSWDSANNQAKADPFIRLGLENAQVSTSAKQADGFLAKVVPDSGPSPAFTFGLGWSPAKGVFFDGSGRLTSTIAVNQTIGPVEIHALEIALALDGGGLTAGVGIDVAAQIGPVNVSVEGFGVGAALNFGSGNLQIADVGVTLQPPDGLGIEIDTPSVSGGGFLFFDRPNGRYGGALELRAYEIDIKAFGLLETKVPGVSFSFVIMISAEFNPIQLGFGFTLDGVGGLIGINRGVDAKVLADRVRDGTIDNVLFPHNLIQNAPALISELASMFPAVADHHTFGPLAKLGWARIVHGTIGLILELPKKELTIIGNVNAILPKPDNPIVVLDMDIRGRLNFPMKHFELDATLSPNSKVGAYTISGDMATRIDWGDRPNFAISMGGFHSQFTPPPGFPALRRMSIALGINGNPSVTLQGFMALTSNTAQIGAQLDVYASFGATLTGSVGFEAIFVFSPFSFDARLWGNVHVDFLGVGFGMTLDGRISGPSPWVINGEVCVSLWFDSACVGIHKQLDGAPAPVPLPTLDPWLGDPSNELVASRQKVPGLKAAILDTANWSGRLPPGALIGVTYVERKNKDRPPVDPVGIATFRQKAVPLDYEITRFAGTTPSRKGKLTIGPVTAGGSQATSTYVTDWIAPGQYRKMSNDEALSAKPFEQLNAGVELQSAVLKNGTTRNRAIEYRTRVLNEQGEDVTTTAQATHNLPDRHLKGMVKSTSASRLSARLTGKTRFIDIRQPLRMIDDLETFSLTSKATLQIVDGITNVTRSQAAAALDAKAGTSTFNRQQYQIVGSHLAA